ncbi:MAG TPA: hypothetical protein VD993_16985 [Chitinophagaceae bacterium]|nr:hypothetical protein [Chitinophagaceae bacterium]
MAPIKNHDVQSVSIQASTEKVFNYIADPANLPKWTGAFKQADTRSAVLVTPAGELKIALKTVANKDTGSIDWHMTMPDGTVGKAFSRVVEDGNGNAIYTFVLLAPPVPLEQVEGTLAAQMDQLRRELQNLKVILND